MKKIPDLGNNCALYSSVVRLGRGFSDDRRNFSLSSLTSMSFVVDLPIASTIVPLSFDKSARRLKVRSTSNETQPPSAFSIVSFKNLSRGKLMSPK